MPVDTGAIIRRSDGVVVRQIGGQTLLIPLHQTGADMQKVYLLNETAAAVWEGLCEPRTLDSLVTHLKQQYDSPAEVIRGDVEKLLEDLVAREFVRVEVADVTGV